MKYLVELDYHKTGQPFTEDTGRTFTERIILPTLARAKELVQQGASSRVDPSPDKLRSGSSQRSSRHSSWTRSFIAFPCTQSLIRGLRRSLSLAIRVCEVPFLVALAPGNYPRVG
jgi:hypothetical protein